MSLNTMSPVFRFTTLRNPKPTEVNGTVDVLLSTNLVNDLISINESGNTDELNLNAANSLLQNYISSDSFIKNKQEFYGKINTGSPNNTDLCTMYDNMLVRLITRSNTNVVYSLLIRYIREFAASLNSVTVDSVRIIIPERITFSFTAFQGSNTPVTPSTEATTLLQNMEAMLAAKSKIAEARNNNIILFSQGQVTRRNLTFMPLLQYFGKSELTVNAAETAIGDRLSELETARTTGYTFPQTDSVFSGVTSLSEVESSNVHGTRSEKELMNGLKNLVQKAMEMKLPSVKDTESFTDTYYDPILTALEEEGPLTVEAAEKKVNDKLAGLFSRLHVVMPGRTYALIAGQWTEVTNIVSEGEVVNDENGSSVLVYSQGCYIKYPIQVADLRAVEQQTVGYLPAEIAHINNTQKGEKNTRVTRRLKKVESSEMILNESEVTKETDSQSTERFSIENDAYQVQQEQNGFNINASVSYSMGPMSATVSGGYSSSSLEISGNSSAQTYAKEIMTRIVDRVSNRIRIERSVKTIEEFEETVTHEIDNSTQETKSYVYRWLNKLVRGTLKNYGKRLMFQVDIAHPAHYYLARSIKERPQLNIPADPRDFKINGVPFNPQMINASNYLSWGKLYNVKLEAPPDSKIIVTEVFTGTSDWVITGKQIPIKQGYQCVKAIVTNTYGNGWPFGNQLRVMIGNWAFAFYAGGDDFWSPRTCWLSNERENLPVTIYQGRQGYIMNIEVHCDLTPEALRDWQVKTYYDILDGYDKLKAAAESKINDFDLNAPGLSPGKKMELIRTELKKEAIRKLYRCNPFWVDDNYQVGREYSPECCKDSTYAERVRFIESVFDWGNMTYELHPYFYSNKKVWSKLLDLTDDDPHFEAFMRSSYATVRIPVFRDKLKEIAACNFLINNAIGNYETIPEGLEDILNELATEPASLFTYDLDGNQLQVPKETVDLGIFPVPTSLVILECSNQDGVKPIGFPQSGMEATDVSIPKQYSPAIIADSCQ